MSPNYEELKEAETFFHSFDRWKNNKHGTVYTVLFIGFHSETLEILVTYICDNGTVWHRPWRLMLEKFTLDFTPLKPSKLIN